MIEQLLSKVENIVAKVEIAHYEQFLTPLASASQAYFMVYCPWCVRASKRQPFWF